MFACLVTYVALLVSRLWRKKKRIFWILFLFNSLSLAMFVWERFGGEAKQSLIRNSYGEGSYTQEYEVSVDGELEGEPLSIEVGEQEYSDEEVTDIFQKMIKELDTIILGENESLDRVERDLYLPNEVDGYPVSIRWELDTYQVMDVEGKIKEEKTTEEGTLVEVRGTLSYGASEATYVAHVMVYPRTKTEKEKWLDAITNEVKETEISTKKEKSFDLPDEIQGKEIKWQKKTEQKGYYVLVLGVVLSALLLWREFQDKKEKQERLRVEMMRDYPDIVSKFALLFGTGMTTKNAWAKIVEGYDRQKAQIGRRAAYEEMSIAYREMQSGVPEKEAYERFGKRCGLAPYMKFGALLSQNVKKGSRGFCQTLKFEAIQAFESRKRTAKQLGEEASTKLLLPMFGMLLVVMIMVIVPAFLSIQL